MAELLLSNEMTDRICALIKEANYIVTACHAVGISKQTYYNWMKSAEIAKQKSESGKKISGRDKIYLYFFDSIKKAESDAEVFLLKTIRIRSLEQWQAAAWILERKYKDRWGRYEIVEHRTDKGDKEETRKLIELLGFMDDEDIKKIEKNV